MSASSYDSCEPVHKGTLCGNDVIEWVFLQCIVRFRHLSHMLSHYAQISSSIHARLFGSVRYCMLIWWGWKPKIYLLSEPPSTCIAFLYVRSDTTSKMDPRCVRAANALMRLCICTGSSKLSMFA